MFRKPDGLVPLKLYILFAHYLIIKLVSNLLKSKSETVFILFEEIFEPIEYALEEINYSLEEILLFRLGLGGGAAYVAGRVCIFICVSCCGDDICFGIVTYCADLIFIAFSRA